MSGAPRSALLLCNPRARNGALALDAIREILRAGGIAPIEPGSPVECCAAIRAHAGAVDLVILGGGDGTLNAAAPALVETGLPFAILPLGTANDLARTLELPTEPADAAAVILAGRTRAIDLGTVNGKPFFNVASVGMTVEITRRLDAATKKRWGRLAYALAAVRVALTQKRFSALIRAGGNVHRVRTMQITVGNGRFYGGGMVVHAEAAIDDHMLFLYSLEPKSRWSLLWMARAFRQGEHEELDDVRTDRARVVEIVTRLPREVSADGEIVSLTPARFSVLPGAITVFVP